jgi:hypothetical protein
MKFRLLLALAALAVAACASASTATASQLIDRNAAGAMNVAPDPTTQSRPGITLSVNARAEALLTYTAGGKLKHVLAWGAVNAQPPAKGGKQLAFQLDYAGGFGKYHDGKYWQKFPATCGAYDGPPLAWLVAACKAPDGSYWALQSWQRGLPDYALAPKTLEQSAWELRLSHFTATGPTDLPQLQINLDWGYGGRWQHLYGIYSYHGQPVFGFASTSAGAPGDAFGRNIYVDTFNSKYAGGAGKWVRENSFLTHGAGGTFCYLFSTHGSHVDGTGTQYRATSIGPGVSPDPFWQGDGLGAYDKTLDQQANKVVAGWHDDACRPN